MVSDSAWIVANGNRRQVTLPCTLSAFVGSCGWKETQVVVELNGRSVRRDDMGTIRLAEGDNLEIIVPVAGG